MRKTLSPFNFAGRVSQPKSVGGSRPIVQNTAEALAHDAPNHGAPMLAARIYSPSAMKHYDDSDPRFMGKSDNVENVYLAAPVVEAPRSGLAQILSWLTTGVMK